MAVVKKTTTSYGTRVKNSFKGIGTGILMFIIGTIILFWNEGRTVKTTRMLKGAQNVCVEADASIMDQAVEGRLVHAVAEAKSSETLTDSEFGVSVPNAVKLERRAEYYQWVEHKHEETKDKVGGSQETTITYTYSKEWVSSPVNSGSFQTQYDEGHSVVNTVRQNVDDERKVAEVVNFGAYVLDEKLKGGIPCSQPCKKFYINANGVNDITDGNEPSPEIGDVRVTITQGLGGTASILAVVQGNSFTKYYDQKNDKSLETLYMGNVPMEQMFQSEHKKNSIWGWVLRVIGILLVVGGLKSIFGFVETIAKVLPFVANIIGFGIGLISWVVGLVWSILIICIAWLTYRPVAGVIALLAIAGLIAFIVVLNKKKKAAAAAEAEVPQTPAE